jgi:Amt family ammonium transporter
VRLKSRLMTVAAATAAVSALGATAAFAQDGPTAESLAYDLDVVWVGVAAAMVFLMQAGFALVESGLTRAKNAANIVAKNLADMSIGAIAYWAVGAGLAYGATQGGFFGGNGFFFQPGAEGAALGGDGVQFVFQLVFAATAATIVSGAVAERMKFPAYLLVSLVITGLVYPIVSHWQWYGEGAWLYDLGYYDFAGSSLVHMTGGVAGLVGAAILGARRGKYGKDGRPRAIPGHNVPFAITGVFILWFGWLGFNGGSTLGANGAGVAIGGVLTTTMLAAAAGGLLAGATSWIVSKKPDPAMAGNGVLAGLVGITAAPDYAGTLAAVLVGAFCGAVVVFAVMFFDRIRIDDPVGAVSVHGVCGAIGTLAVGLYPAARADGITIGTQAIGVLAIGAFVAATTAVTFLIVKATIGVRVSEEEELEGLDVHEHGMPAYAPDVLAGVGTSRVGAYGFQTPGAVAPSARPAEE